MKKRKEQKKYRHITVQRLYDMKDRYMAQQKNRITAIVAGSAWIGDFIKFVKAHKNEV